MAKRKIVKGSKWIWVVLLVLVGGGAAYALSGGKVGTSQNKDEVVNTANVDSGGGTETAQESSQNTNFGTASKTKAVSGENYTLQNIRIGVQTDYERVVFDLGGGTKAPGYKVSISGNQIQVLLYDTLNRDVNYKPTYTGPNTVSGQGGIISSVELYAPPDDSMIGFKINLTGSLDFRVVEFTNPTRIAVDVKK
jgi:hypothetical protein